MEWSHLVQDKIMLQVLATRDAFTTKNYAFAPYAQGTHRQFIFFFESIN
jgi:hypothetical protein